jgi:hypothetical protein
VQLLARYAALYSDTLVLPVDLPCSKISKDDAAFQLVHAVLSILETRPLIEAGIVQLAHPTICRQCFESDPRILTIRSTAKKIMNSETQRFSGTWLKWGNEGAVELIGPDDYLDHGHLMVAFSQEQPSWLPVRARRAKRRAKLTSRALQNSGIITHMFERIALDLIWQQIVGMKYNTKYLMGLQGEMQVLSALTEEPERYAKRTALCESLAHEVPMFSELSLATAVRIRREDGDAFVAYRDALNRIMRDHLAAGGGVSAQDARQIFCEFVEPKLRKLRARAEGEKKSRRNKALAKGLIPAVLITLGLFGGLLPAQWSELLKVIGGFGLARELGETLSTLGGDTAEVKSDEFYFLLRVARETN